MHGCAAALLAARGMNAAHAIMRRMLLFHGTMAPALDGILKDGLRPPHASATAHDWVWDLSGRSQGSAVFLSTAPVAGKGGDPASFAMGWPARRRAGHYPGYIVIVDLPPEAIDLVRAVVPNVELDTFISVYRARSFLRGTFRLEASHATGASHDAVARWTLSHWCLHYWLARYCADYHIPLTPSALNARLPLQLESADPALPADLTPTRWQAFLDDYFKVVAFADQDIRSEAERERRRQSILRRHGFVLPDHIEEDDHSKRCSLCIGGLARFVHRFEGFADYQPLRDFLHALPMKSAYHRLPDTARVGTYIVGAPLRTGGLGAAQSLALQLRAVADHTTPFAEREVESFFRTHESPRRSSREESWTWEQWYARFPAERCALSSAWRPGYCQRFSAADLKRPDRQVIADAIPLPYVLGAIKITDGARLLAHLRPNRRKGETLAAKLWTLAHALRAQYAGTPVLIE
jgi:hypothetical protein